MIDRGFVRIGAGQVHYRSAGAQGMPSLIMAHGGPGSSAGLVPLISELSSDRRVFAPDMLGNGDSDPPPVLHTDIDFYRDCLVAFMDAIGLARADFYGSHTGAQIVCELAITHPERVGSVVLDGIALFPDELRAEFLAHYAPAMMPLDDGSHLAWLWNFIQKMPVYFPYYKTDAEHATGGAVPTPDVATTRAAEVLKVWPTFHIAYRAAFRHRVRERLPLLRVPTLVLETAGDPLAHYAAQAAALIVGARTAPTTYSMKSVVIQKFLSEQLAKRD